MKRKRNDKRESHADGTTTGTVVPPGQEAHDNDQRVDLLFRSDGDHRDEKQNGHLASDEAGEWQQVDRATRRKLKKLAGSYPALTHSANARLNTFVKIADLQNLVLYLLADGTAPQWLSVRHHQNFDKVVVLMVPGLDSKLFDRTVPLDEGDGGEGTTISVKVDDMRNGHHQQELEKQEQEERVPETHGHLSTAGKPTQRMRMPPDDFFPQKLATQKLPGPLKPLVEMFTHIWPVKTPGDNRRMHSPMYAMLSSPIVRSKEEKNIKGPKPPAEGKGWKDKRTPITEYIASKAELLENGYAIHPALLSTQSEIDAEIGRRYRAVQSAADGWVDILDIKSMTEGAVLESQIEAGSILKGRRLLVMDCEMVSTTLERFSLARVSLIDYDGNVVLDELVKPPDPVKDYLTPYSGITKEMLDGATLTLSDIQNKLKEILTPQTILSGHSLDSDLRALKISYPFIVDTTLLYPHPKGPPQKSSLKWLTQKYLGREIQKSSTMGHDSVEDAKACLDLIKQKCEKGKTWGTPDAQGESIFKRLARTGQVKSGHSNGSADTAMHVDQSADEDDGPPRKTGAMIDWTGNMHGFGATAAVAISCTSDSEVVSGVIRAVNGDARSTDTLFQNKVAVPEGGCDFTFARLRELEFARGWSPSLHPSTSSTTSAPDPTSSQPTAAAAATPDLTTSVRRTMANIQKIYNALPPRTAVVLFSGSGDPREMIRLQQLNAKHRAEYLTTKWDELETVWTDVEEQMLKRAVEEARRGVGFVGVTPAPEERLGGRGGGGNVQAGG